MGFFEFDAADEWVEAGTTTASRPAPSTPPRRPAPPPSSRTAAPTGQTTTTSPATPGRPGGASRTPARTTTPSRPSPADRSSGTTRGFDLGKLTQGLQKGLGFVQQGMDVAQKGYDFAQFFRPPGGPGAPPPAMPPGPSGPDVPPAGAPFSGPGVPPEYPSPAPGPDGATPMLGAPPAGMPPSGPPAQGYDQLATMLQALYQRQIPPLPGPAFASPAYPGWAPLAPPQNDPMATLLTIMGNPQFQQALHWSSVMGPAGPRNIQLPIPAPGYPGDTRSMAIPMGAVMNTIAALASQSRNQFGATTREDEAEVPEYLVGEQGDFIVDPASPDDRAALVAHLFLLNDEAQRSGWFQPPDVPMEDAEAELDESEQWAFEAGFTR